jgi:hypothetical protein
VTAWKDLREAVRTALARFEDRRSREVVRERHDIEKKIAEIERRPANASRDKLLRHLRERLGGGQPVIAADDHLGRFAPSVARR